MPKQMYTLNDFSGGLNTVKDPRDIKNNELVAAQNIMVDEQGAVRTVGGMVSHTELASPSHASALVGGYGLAMLESDYETEPKTITGSSDIDFNNANPTFALIDGTTGADLEDTFVPGDEILVTGTSNNDGYYTIHNTESTFHWLLVPNNSITTEYNTSATLTSLPQEDILIILSDADNNKVDTYSKNEDTWTADQITQYSPSGDASDKSRTVFYAIDGAIRVSDADFHNGCSVKWFGQIKRTHFEGATAQDFYFNFFEKDNKLSPPTDGAVGDTYPVDNAGFDLDILTPANSDSTWAAATYQVASSFVYDGNQESLLFEYPSDTHDFDVADGDSVTISVHAKTDGDGYNPRISGARIYAKIDGSDESWFVLCDVDMRRGARATLDGDYIAWEDGASAATDIDTGVVTSLSQNLDTYESLNGYSHNIQSNSIGEDGEQWKWGLVANRRAFIFNVRRHDKSINENVRYSDRMYFSESGRFDTFPSSNYIDVVRGDSESYVAASEYADRILAFKDNSVQIVNISSPSPSGWFLEKNEKYMGVVGPACVVKTQYGIVWVNDNGCFLYNGSSIKNLMDDKIDDDEWADFIGNSVNAHYSSIGYEKHKKQLIIMRDCTGTAGSSGDAYLYDFKTKSWVKLINAFSDSIVHSNFIHDWNGDLVVGYESGGNVAFKKWDSDDTTISKSDIVLTTKDIDFGSPALDKKVYAAYVTYKSSAEQNLPLEFAVDGTGSFSDFSTGTNVQPQGNTGGAGYLESTASAGSTWDVATFTADSVQTCQSIQFKFNPPTAGTFNINDISIEYRQLRKRVT